METNQANSNEIPTTDPNIYSEYVLFSIGPILCLLAASYGAKAWARWEILFTSVIAFMIAFKTEHVLSVFVSTLSILPPPSSLTPRINGFL